MNDIQKYIDDIRKDIHSHRVILFIKGSKLMPRCGFSGRVVNILNRLGVTFSTRNVLEDKLLHQAIKEFSNWPTIPQLYINSEFIGGCDIVTEMFENGELQKLFLESASEK